MQYLGLAYRLVVNVITEEFEKITTFKYILRFQILTNLVQFTNEELCNEKETERDFHTCWRGPRLYN
jgi:hypothetical protein